MSKPALKPMIATIGKTLFKRLVKIDRIEDLEKFDRAAIARLSLTDDDHASLLMALMQYKLRNASKPEWSAAFTDYETAESAALLWDTREEVGKGITNFDLFHAAIDSRKDYDGLRFKKLVLDLIDTFFEVFDAADFYSGLRQIGFYDTPAARMANKGGFIDSVDSCRENPSKLIRGYLQSGVDNRVIGLAFSSLDSLLRSLCRVDDEAPFIRWGEFGGFFYQFKNTATKEEMFGPNPAPDIDDFKVELGKISLLFKNLQTALRLREHEVYDRHPEWEITVGKYDEYSSPDAPFNFAKDRLNQSKELRAYYNQYGNPVGRFEEMTDILSTDNQVLNALPELEKLISTPTSYSYESEIACIETFGRESLVSGQINPWIVGAKKSMIDALRAFCDRRANALPPESKARELWLHVNAKIRLASQGVETEAKAIVDTMKQAAEQELVEGSDKTKTKEEDDVPTLVESDWKKWPKRPPRFRCDTACTNVVDYVHSNNPKYREIRHYTSMPVSAQKAIRLLLAAASKNCEDDWWIPGQDEDGKSFIQAFQSKANKAARRFYNEQIEVGGSAGEHKGKWRILPETMFDDNYRDKHPSADALSGS